MRLNNLQCARSPQVLQQTYTMVERAMEISPNSAEYPTEAGYQLLLQGRTRDAFKCYKNAMKLDETSVVALTGIGKGGHFLKEFFFYFMKIK